MSQGVAEDYSDLQRQLERVMRRLCPPWLVCDLDDLVQAAQLKIYRRGGAVEDLHTTFLYRVGHSVMVDEIRRRKRRKEVQLDPATAPEPVHDQELGPERTAAGHELGAAIHACLGELKPDYRRAVSLHLHGHTVREIGEILEIDLKSADNRVYRGMAKLRACLGKRGLP